MKNILLLIYGLTLVGCSPKFKVGECIKLVNKNFEPTISSAFITGEVVAINSSLGGLKVSYAIKTPYHLELQVLNESEAEATECNE